MKSPIELRREGKSRPCICNRSICCTSKPSQENNVPAEISSTRRVSPINQLSLLARWMKSVSPFGLFILVEGNLQKVNHQLSSILPGDSHETSLLKMCHGVAVLGRRDSNEPQEIGLKPESHGGPLDRRFGQEAAGDGMTADAMRDSGEPRQRGEYQSQILESGNS
jgi:hypothetical protein